MNSGMNQNSRVKELEAEVQALKASLSRAMKHIPVGCRTCQNFIDSDCSLPNMVICRNHRYYKPVIYVPTPI